MTTGAWSAPRTAWSSALAIGLVAGMLCLLAQTSVIALSGGTGICVATPVLAAAAQDRRRLGLVAGIVAWLVLGLFVGGLALSRGDSTLPGLARLLVPGAVSCVLLAPWATSADLGRLRPVALAVAGAVFCAEPIAALVTALGWLGWSPSQGWFAAVGAVLVWTVAAVALNLPRRRDLVICGVVFVVALAVAVQGLGYLTAFALVS